MSFTSTLIGRPAILAVVCLATLPGDVLAQTQTSFQGDIGTTFGSVTDTCAFTFALFDATAGGSQLGPVIERELRVRGGLYETELDFGPEATDGDSRYLEVAVGCPADTAELTTLTRRAFLPGATARSGRAGRVTPASENLGAPPKAALGTAFTYQGELKELGSPVTGPADFQFSLWDALSGGVQIGATIPANAVSVVDGRFTSALDFGAAAFNGDARWLEIAVDYPAGTGSFTTLSPRQPLSAAPYALQTRGIFVDDGGNVGIGTDTPTGPFHVVGSTTIDGTLSIASGHGIQLPDPSTRVYSDLGDLRLESSDDIKLQPADELDIDNGTLVVDSSTNRVGIGTDTPGYPFHVLGSTMVDGDLHIDTGHSIQFPDTSNRISAIYGDLKLKSDDDIVIHPGNLFAVDFLTLTVNSTTNRVGVGTTSADEMLHVQNQISSGDAFLKIETSHPSNWGETGIRFETPQNRWHLRMDDDANNNLPEGALGLRCNTPGHEIMTWTEDGTVGIGTTQPTAKLDVVGDLELSGAYRGSIGPNNGAPFPRPAYDSGWVAVGEGAMVTLNHGIGGDRDDYVVDLQFKDAFPSGNIGVHSAFVGSLYTDSGFYHGAYWKELTSTDINVYRASDDIRCDQVRVRIWVVN